MQDYFQQLIDTARQAVTVNGQQTRTYRVAGRLVQAHFAGSALLSVIHPPLAHLAVDDTQLPDLELFLWDSHSTGLQSPDFPNRPAGADIWRYHDGRLTGYGFNQPNHEGMMWLDRRENKAVYWAPSAGRVSSADHACPLLWLWSWWLSVHQIHLVHAATIAGEQSAAMLVGKSGSGKSTTAQLALNSGLKYMADDYSLVDVPARQVYSLYSACRVMLADRVNYPWLDPTYASQDHEKAVFHLFPALKDKLALQRSIKAIFVPKITGAPSSRILPVSPAQVLRAVAPNTLVQLRVGIDPQQALQAMSALARQVPCFALELGADRNQTTALLTEFLGEA